MKKYFIWAMVSIVVAFAGCSDDEVDSPPFLIGNSQGVIDGKAYSVLGLGNGCDITQTIGKGNVKEQILDLELLMKDKGIELDDTPAPYKIYRTGRNYAEMTNALNKCLAGEMNFELPEVAFGRNLDNILLEHISHREMDIYEYGACMYVNKLASLAVNPQFHGQIKDYVTETAWSEINATDADNRTDKAAIKKLFVKYGTHVATKTFYGIMCQYLLARERHEWESDLWNQLELGVNAKVSLSESNFNVNGKKEFIDISDTDNECFKHSSGYKREDVGMIGGGSVYNFEDWWKSATLDDLSTCALLGYSLNVEGGEDSGLIPLYELLDDGDARKNAMKEALNEYVQENKIVLTCPGLVLVDAFGKHFDNGDAPEYLYSGRNGRELKYFRLDEEISQHVRGITKGKFYFYYSLGYPYDKAVVDMKFDDSSDLDDGWMCRGDHANDGVTGDVKNRYLCVKYEHSNDVSENEFVTGFGVKVDGKIAAISKYTGTGYNWIQNGDLWYKGLVHDDVYCIYTKDRLKGY